MVTRTSYDKLSSDLQEVLGDYSYALAQELDDAYKQLAEFGRDELAHGGPYHNRTGQYAKNFDITQRATLSKKTSQIMGVGGGWTIYNKKRYQLTHLLEFGHDVYSHGRSGKAKPYAHWKPTLEAIDSMTEQVIRAAAERAAKRS